MPQCVDLLRDVRVGRLVFTEDDPPAAQPWVDGRPDHFIRIETQKMTGRRFREPGSPQYRPAGH